MSSLQVQAERLRAGVVLETAPWLLSLHGCNLRVASNSAALLGTLERYLAAFLTVDDGRAAECIEMIERPPLPEATGLRDWPREPGKSGRKDAWLDLTGGRLIHKLRTGLSFLQSAELRIAAGPCTQHPNQLINFLNTQILNLLQQRGDLLGHAAALVFGERALVIAGLSGGGKSTLMLHLLRETEAAFLSNDRVLIRREDESLSVRGIAKWPRVNPGTLLHDPILCAGLDARRRAEYAALDAQTLWSLEDKHDVLVPQLYGTGRVCLSARLGGVLILDWQRDVAEPTRLEAVDLRRSPELLAALEKSPGPFFQRRDGQFLAPDTAPDRAAYLAQMGDCPAWVLRGRLDFARALTLCTSELGVIRDA